ncbi:MAG: alpha/beta fold hydrolase [Gammaproteobacteria bacterium]|nr:alpha/beta fold hydrolase [Gammaproteobacteria bacterium]
MVTFVLVHGAWYGGWCWAELQHELRGLGHESHAPTLTGLGERSHLLAPDIDTNLHVLDVVNTIRWRELDDIVLVGHSYGGMVVTGVAAQIPEKLRAVVYLDAFVPEVSDVLFVCEREPRTHGSIRRADSWGPDGA